jgi:tRNA modification GTPase
VANKSDRPAAFEYCESLHVSATNGTGVRDVRRALVRALTGDDVLSDHSAITNVRHAALVEQARAHLEHARAALAHATPEEFVLADLHAARSSFDEVVGVRASDEILRHIFEKFCIGK